MYVCEDHYVSFRVKQGLTQVRKHSGSLLGSLCFIEGRRGSYPGQETPVFL